MHVLPAAQSAQSAQLRPRLRGIWVPLVTPLGTDGTVEAPALTALVARLAADGATGFVACGSTGEASLLTPHEQERVLRAARAGAGDLPVLMGLSGADANRITAHAHALHAACPDVAGFLLAPPPYIRPSQAALVAHFHAVADALPAPLVAYDIPARTGVAIEIPTVLALAAHPNIVAVKDCSGDPGFADAILDDGRLVLMAGNDDETFDQFARGAPAAVVARAHVACRAWAALAAAFETGNLPAARALRHRLAMLARATFAEPNPGPIKGALAARGHIGPTLRSPLLPASTAAIDALLRAADALRVDAN